MPFAIPAPDGQAYRLLQQQDWSTSALGQPETWPDTLKVALGLILRSPESMYVVWGAERLFFFNEAYLPILGEARLHRSMGRPMAEVWADVWDAIKDAVDRTYGGASFRYEDQLLRMAREGVPEQTYWTYSFSPLCEPDGAVSGLFCVTREQTKRIDTERRQTTHNTGRARCRVRATGAPAPCRRRPTGRRNDDRLNYRYLGWAAIDGRRTRRLAAP